MNDYDGSWFGDQQAEKIPQAVLLDIYHSMLRIRKVEERIAELVSENAIICPCHLYTGQEAVAVGVCSSLRKDDLVFSTHRSHGHYLAKGGDLNQLFAELFGKQTGCSRGRGGSMHLASKTLGLPGSSAIVAGTIPLAVGAALSFSNREKDNIAVAFFGDGAVGEGTFFESLNFASLKKLPVVFICENNLYSTHMPITSCLANTNIYQMGAAFNVPSLRIDGCNVTEVFYAARSAINRARTGQGPTLIECMTYRWRGHVGPNYDVEKGLRTQDELDYWMDRCPIGSLESTLLKSQILSATEKTKTCGDIEKEIEEAINFAKSSPMPTPDHNISTQNVFKDQAGH